MLRALVPARENEKTIRQKHFIFCARATPAPHPFLTPDAMIGAPGLHADCRRHPPARSLRSGREEGVTGTYLIVYCLQLSNIHSNLLAHEAQGGSWERGLKGDEKHAAPTRRPSDCPQEFARFVACASIPQW
jgi:hypothetical protein